MGLLHLDGSLVLQQRRFKATLGAEDSRRAREETTIQIRKNKKENRMAKRRQMGAAAGPSTPAGLAAANLLASTGDTTYQGMMDEAPTQGVGVRASMAASKLEQLPAMVQGVMGNDPAVQTECTTQFRRLLSIEKNPPIQQVIDAGVVPALSNSCSAKTTRRYSLNRLGH